MKSPQYGHPAHAEVAAGYGPCRQCLQTFRMGTEERLLFTYQPFTDSGALPAPGPVFIHREPCQWGAHRSAAGWRALAFETVLQQALEPPEVQYVHLRNAEAGCFIARIDRQ